MLALLATARIPAGSDARADTVRDEPPSLRVGTTGDYAPFSFRSSRAPDGVDGFDVAVARAYAEDRGLDLELVRMRWRTFVSELESDRFDVAMSGVTVRPERSLAGRFSVPVAESGAVVLVLDGRRFREVEHLNTSAVTLAVNAGGHLEQVARKHFPHATILAIPANDRVLLTLRESLADAAVTDTQEAPRWKAIEPSLDVLGPFTQDTKAYLVRSDDPDLARDLDRWLLEREADGTLAALRQRYLGETAGVATATPLSALLAAMKERLALMPLVAQAKSHEGLPLEAPAQEERVIAGAIEATREGARELGLAAPDPVRIEALMRAQIEAAKELQRTTLDHGGYTRDAPPGLDSALRPALLRIGERMGRLMARLAAEQTPPGRQAIDDGVERALDGFDLDPRRERAIATALAKLAGSTAGRSGAEQETRQQAGQDG